MVRTGERRGNVGLREMTVVEPWGRDTLRSNLCLLCLSGIAGRVFTAEPLGKPIRQIYQSSDVITNKDQDGDCILIGSNQGQANITYA